MKVRVAIDSKSYISNLCMCSLYFATLAVTLRYAIVVDKRELNNTHTGWFFQK